MVDSDTLKELLSDTSRTSREKALCCLALDPLQPRNASEVKKIAIDHGARSMKSANVSDILSKAKGLSIRTSAGWELTSGGKAKVAELAGPVLPAVTTLVISGLRRHLESIKEQNTRSFVEESIKALEAKLYRSAIVFTWVGAVSVLYNHVLLHNLATFNSEAKRRDAKWKDAATADDLARMKEHDFLQVLSAISVLGKSVKDDLEVCLKLRNGCGHPNSLVVGEHKAAAHVESLVENVFKKF